MNNENNNKFYNNSNKYSILGMQVKSNIYNGLQSNDPTSRLYLSIAIQCFDDSVAFHYRAALHGLNEK